MIALVCGSRDWPRDGLRFIAAKIAEHVPPDATTRTGGARGVDLYAESIATATGRPLHVMRADWKAHGKRAGYLRNIAMLDTEPRPSLVIAFQYRGSRGTAHTIREARKRGIPTIVYTEDDL